jgi:hypothetical protein
MKQTHVFTGYDVTLMIAGLQNAPDLNLTGKDAEEIMFVQKRCRMIKKGDRVRIEEE